MSDVIQKLLEELGISTEMALNKAFEAGRALGRREAADAMKSRLASVFDLGESQIQGSLPMTSPATDSNERAAPGSVKPVIMNSVRTKPGQTIQQIQAITGIKHNSVRGTLWTLSKEKAVYRSHGKWFPVTKPETSVERTAEASG